MKSHVLKFAHYMESQSFNKIIIYYLTAINLLLEKNILYVIIQQERKQQHSLRVMKISEQIATNLKLEKEKIQLATLIGLLHDIGRFKQYTEIGLGDNLEGFDHGNYGAEILFEKGIIKNFIKITKGK